MAATGPPPSGPWWAAETETNTAGSPVTAAVTPPTQALIWRCQCTSESSSIALRRPRTCAVLRRLALEEDVDQPAVEVGGARALGQVEAGGADRVPDAVLVERVLHHRVADPVAAADARSRCRPRRPGPGRARRPRSRRRPTEKSERSCMHVGVGGHLDLAERDGDAERGAAVGEVHRLVGVLGPHRLAARLGVADGVDGQQRGLGLHVVHVGGVGDAGPLHRDLHRVGDLLDHRRPGRCPRAAAARSSRSRRSAAARRSARRRWWRRSWRAG